MPEKVHKAADVYGVGRELPLNYVVRKHVDNVFTANLKRDKHVVVYGSSKQGKTSLRKRWLEDEEHIVVSCLNTMSLSDLHAGVLKQAGYKVEQSTTRTAGGQLKVIAEFKGKGKVPLIAEASGGVGLEKDRKRETETVHARLELDLNDVNDVIAALNEISLKQFIVLEDFHYLPIETQKNFAFALKSFHENSEVCFIVVGVWREKNRLVYYNGDLTGRVVAIDAESWHRNELREVITIGESLLNVSFNREFIDGILDNAFDAVYLVQEGCLKACQAAEVLETGEALTIVGANLDPRAIIKEIVDEQAGRYSAFITNFSEGFQKTELEMYKWLLYAVISTDAKILEAGLRRAEVAAAVKAHHPEGAALNEGNITLALQSAASLQVNKNIRPIILDYDQTTKVLNVVDRSFLIWLAYQNRDEILKELASI